ncbi:hypothetical protein DFH09DRAFT_1076291 [Mycena vulgaris]|nr:hypothetical protein DFH09DRAFT_1076291 [Mycena vulgaris]
MANPRSLSAARQRKKNLTSADKTQAVAKLPAACLQSSGPLSVPDHRPLEFPESDTPMVASSDVEDSDSVEIVHQTRSAKRKSELLIDSDSDLCATPPKKKPGPKPKRKSDQIREDSEEESPKPAKKKTAAKQGKGKGKKNKSNPASDSPSAPVEKAISIGAPLFRT